MAKKGISQVDNTKALITQAQWEEVDSVKRIRDVPSARELYSSFMLENTKRCANFVEIRGAVEGARPRNQTELESQGMGWQANCNTGDARALLERAQKPFHTLVESQPERLSFTIHTNGTHTQKYEKAFAKNFDRFIDDWGADYKSQWQMLSDNHIQFGSGVALWPFQDSPRWASVNVERVLFPKDARISPDKWDIVMMIRDVPVSELWLKISDKKNRKTNEEAGWNIDALKQAIFYNLYGNQRRDYRDFTRWADDMVQNDVVITGKYQPLQLVWAYVRNLDGKIGCYVFTVDGSVNEFLFQDDKYAEKWQEIMGAVWYDTGRDGLVHSVKGFLVKNYYHIQAIQRLKLRLIDSAAIGLSLNFKYGEDTPSDSPPIANFGPINMFPAGLEQVNTYPQIQQGAAILEMLVQNQAENSSLYKQQTNDQIAQSNTARQASILAAQAGELTEASAALFLSQVGESIFSEQVRRLRKKGNTDPDAKSFVRRMRADGVPDEIIFDAEIRVQCAASAGIASALMREQRAQQALMMTNMQGSNQRYWLEQYVAYTWGSNAVDKGLLPEGTDSAPYERKVAMLENASLGQGMQLPVDQAEAHFEHAQEHLKPLSQIAGQYMQTQQITPEATAALVMGIQHVAQHIEFLKQDETAKEKYQAVWPTFSQISSVATGIMRQMQKQQIEAQQQGGGMPQGAPPTQMVAPGQGM